MSFVSTLPAPALAERVPSKGRYHDIYFAALLLCVAAYGLTGKGFAYAGIAPFFPGEIMLLAGMVTFLLPFPSLAVFISPPSILLAMLMVLTIARTIPFIGIYKIDALRDTVIVMYGIFGFVIANLILEKPTRIDQAMRWAGTFFTIYGFSAAVIYVSQKYLGNVIPHWPGSDTPLIALRGGEVAVQAGGAALFGLLGLKRSTLAWVVMLFLGVVVVSAQSRGGMLAVVVPLLLAAVLTGRFKALFLLMLGVLPIVFVLYVTNFEVPMQSDRRTVTVPQLVDNAVSIFVTTHSSDKTLDDTKAWRLRWWNKVIDYTIHGPYFWKGKGFGISLAESDGFLGTGGVGPPLRSPHSAHMTILARTGVPGLTLWIATGLAWLWTMGRSIYLSRRRGDDLWSRMLIFILCDWIGCVINSSFDVALEGPMVGVLFWVLFGSGIGLSLAYEALCRERVANLRAEANPW
ncbi:O-antigen ligase family protein [Lichenihabitans psoromatis]|uniref:O-antigen ligase family protein n=1 Tax=Lichenihabitans psoromatis TaxID=2528642 RepID=UPI001036E825|nr:O-antigen ligase family protein [Lichenihabitans psoromatis]